GIAFEGRIPRFLPFDLRLTYRLEVKLPLFLVILRLPGRMFAAQRGERLLAEHPFRGRHEAHLLAFAPEVQPQLLGATPRPGPDLRPGNLLLPEDVCQSGDIDGELLGLGGHAFPDGQALNRARRAAWWGRGDRLGGEVVRVPERRARVGVLA